jgi:beta,beta-carotene 9',10'-dioxygenase
MNNKFKGGLETQSHEIVVEELTVEGNIPDWLVGSLIRNTPAQYEIGAQSYRHWFDGLAMLYSFTFENGRVSYRNRFIESKAHRENNETGEIKFSEFGTNRRQSLFSRLSTVFKTPLLGGNTNVNVARFGEQFVALTENHCQGCFGRHTLETIGTYDYEQTDAQLSTAHPQFDFARNLGITYAAKIGKSSEFRRYRIPLSVSGRATYKLVTDENIEFPRINYERYNGKPYGCVFGASIQQGKRDFYNQLTKFDLATGVVEKWCEANCYPG